MLRATDKAGGGGLAVAGGREEEEEEEGEEEGDGGDVEATLRRKSSRAAVDERARVTSGCGGRRRFVEVAVLAVAVFCRKRCSSIFRRLLLL